ncbi:MAG: family 1 glycosylhydrolase, partial [Candidatus Doudnabacteria bacterium]|nr:family 1 glycosylhydrolase [Candidatus Doudnabacteria bacterium]
AVEHYRKVLQKMKELGLVRMVTLHHFTLPQWMAEKGGFQTKTGIGAFARYAWFIAQNLGEEIDIWCTINEPEVYTSESYVFGKWPPFKKNYFLALKIFNNLTRAHIAAYNAVKGVLPSAQVGIVKNNVYYESAGGLLSDLVCKLADYFGNKWFLNKVNKRSDFIGLNFYNTRTLHAGLTGIKVLNSNARPKSDMGWQTFPEGIYHVLTGLRKYLKPIYITENGIANARDDMRQDYIRQHLKWVLKAVSEGLDIRGYFYWSLIDNYEWAAGFDPKFGLVGINYENQKRTIRPSANVIKEIAYE